MTDMSKYKNVSLTKETYATLDKLSKGESEEIKWQVQKKLKKYTYVLPVEVMAT